MHALIFYEVAYICLTTSILFFDVFAMANWKMLWIKLCPSIVNCDESKIIFTLASFLLCTIIIDHVNSCVSKQDAA